MANTLFKLSTITGEPGTAGSPSIPGRPGSPGYWTTETDSSGFARQAALSLLNASRQGGLITDEEYVAALANLPPEEPKIRVFIPGTAEVPGTPGTPGTESTLVTDLNIGWNAGARSIQSESGPFAVEFTFSQETPAARAGINNGQDQGAVTTELGWAFSFELGAVRVFERDAFIVIAPATVSAGAVFKIERDGAGVITYYIDDVLVYTSLKLCFGTAFLDGLIYIADSGA